MQIVSDVDHIMVIDDVFSAELCQEIIRRFEADPAKNNAYSTTNDKLSMPYRQGLCITISERESWRDIDQQLYQGITEAARCYMLRYNIQTDAIDNGYTVARFEPGEVTRPHIDSVHGKSVFRLITAVCYLNDLDQGGETYFIQQGASVKPKRGRVVLFPPFFTHPHGSTPASDRRYIMVTWICSNPNLFKPGEPL